MSDKLVSLASIRGFLAEKRIAMIGVSHQPEDFSVTLFREFVRRGYEIYPVNPKLSEVEGKRCFARVQDIRPVVEAAILMTPPAVTAEVVRDCDEAGVLRVWMYSAGNQGAINEDAVAFCRARGIQVIRGHCPFMFWNDSHLGHRLHGVVLKIMGRYPSKKTAAAA